MTEQPLSPEPTGPPEPDNSPEPTGPPEPDNSPEPKNKPSEDNAALLQQMAEMQNELKKEREDNKKYRTETEKKLSHFEKLKEAFSDDKKPQTKAEKDLETLLNKALSPIKEGFDKMKERLDAQEGQKSFNNFAESQGITSKEGKEFLEFKLAKAESEDGDITEDKMKEIIKEVNETFEKKKGPSSLSEGDKPKVKDPSSFNKITYENFKKMNPFDRSDFYEANPKLYNKYSSKEIDESSVIEEFA